MVWCVACVQSQQVCQTIGGGTGRGGDPPTEMGLDRAGTTLFNLGCLGSFSASDWG
jgi:hypothetical protein